MASSQIIIDRSGVAELEHSFPSLAGQPLFKSVFRDLRSLDDLMREMIRNEEVRPIEFDPLQYDSLLGQVSELADRLLAYRREAYDLESLAIKTALDFVLYDEQRSALKEIELASAVEQQRRAERDHQLVAASNFRQDQQSLNTGFAELALSGAASNSEAIGAEQRRKELVQNKWAAHEKYQTALKGLFLADGCALNYSERLQRIRVFFFDDLKHAYRRARAVEVGMRARIGIPRGLPSSQAQDFLGEFVLWVRDSIEHLEQWQADDVEFEKRFLLFPHEGPGQISLIAGPMQQEYTNSREYHFEITPNIKEQSIRALSGVRLRGIGLSLLYDQTAPELHARRMTGRCSAVIFVPPQHSSFGAQYAVRRPAILSNVTWTHPTVPVEFARGPYLNNSSIEGRWTVRVSEWFTPADNLVTNVHTHELIYNIMLHLLISAKPSKTINEWVGLRL